MTRPLTFAERKAVRTSDAAFFARLRREFAVSFHGMRRGESADGAYGRIKWFATRELAEAFRQGLSQACEMHACSIHVTHLLPDDRGEWAEHGSPGLRNIA